ncbi:MAG: methyltransferase domain-containing protein [Anaerolineaceae bacterium]
MTPNLTHPATPGIKVQKDYLWENISKLPYFRGLLRAVEARFYQDIDLPGPILDMGCGDGDFASMTFDWPLDAGIDPWTGPVRKARDRNCYRLVIQGQGKDMPFEAGYFRSVISNSVLEHIPDVQTVLEDIARVTIPGGVFVFCVPSENFLANLSISSFFDSIGLRKVGNAYRGFFNAISRHYHCDPAATWQGRLEKTGFELEKWWNYFPPSALHTLEWGHYFGLPSFLIHLVTRRWILVQQKWNLALTRKMIEGDYLRDPLDPQGSYTFYIARRK